MLTDNLLYIQQTKDGYGNRYRKTNKTRLNDKITGLSLLPVMQSIATSLFGKIHNYKTKDKKDFLCVYISRLSDLNFIVYYFNKYPLKE